MRAVLTYKDAYVAFVYTDKQLQDIEQFCCKETGASVLGIDTTYNLCDMWVTDTSYRNHRVMSTRNKKHPVALGPVMFHFAKEEETFRRFCLELIAGNPKLMEIKKVGVDMESAIFNGFKSVLIKLTRLNCVTLEAKRGGRYRKAS